MSKLNNAIKIPMALFPYSVLESLSKRFLERSRILLKAYPEIKMAIIQSNFEIEPEEYLSAGIFSSIINAFLVFFLSFFFSMIFKLSILNSFLISLLFLFAVFFINFFIIMNYPKIFALKRGRRMEENMLYAMRDLLIKLKSGVSLYDSFVALSRRSYGDLSEEFKITTKKMSAGQPQISAIEEMALRNPSQNFRKILWQISNAMRAGADISNTLESIIDNLSKEQKVKIRNFGGELNPIAMMYMVITVVAPTMGITLLVVLSSFASLPIGKNTFYAILGVISFFQLIFLTIIKSKREAIGI